MSKHQITRADILSLADYEAVRPERKKQIVEMKKNRRLAIGPDATIYFENYDTMWHQIHEMLRIEKGGDAQIDDELSAYNPLIPNGRELVATLMFEIEDPVRRDQVLRSLGGVEHSVYMEIAGETVEGKPETDVERTDERGKASSIQFLHFPLTDAQAAAFKAPGANIRVGVGHEHYGHLATMGDAVREALAKDLA